MKYIVWELISAYDGYFTTEVNTWEDALKVVEKTLSHYPHKYEKFLKALKKGDKFDIGGDRHIFITTVCLTGPVN